MVRVRGGRERERVRGILCNDRPWEENEGHLILGRTGMRKLFGYLSWRLGWEGYGLDLDSGALGDTVRFGELSVVSGSAGPGKG